MKKLIPLIFHRNVRISLWSYGQYARHMLVSMCMCFWLQRGHGRRSRAPPKGGIANWFCRLLPPQRSAGHMRARRSTSQLATCKAINHKRGKQYEGAANMLIWLSQGWPPRGAQSPHKPAIFIPYHAPSETMNREKNTHPPSHS